MRNQRRSQLKGKVNVKVKSTEGFSTRQDGVDEADPLGDPTKDESREGVHGRILQRQGTKSTRCGFEVRTKWHDDTM